MSRTRTRSTISPATPWIFKNYPFNQYTGTWGVPTTLSSGSTSESNLQESIVDVVVPEFTKRSARGEIFNNPYSQTKTLIETPVVHLEWFIRVMNSKSGSYTITKQSGTMGFAQLLTYFGLGAYGSYLPLIIPATDDLFDQSARAVTSAFANRSTAETLSLVTALELAKSVASIGGILKNVNKIARVTRKKFTKVSRQKYTPYNIKPDTIKDKLRQPSRQTLDELRSYEELWMEARYNLRPLYYDIMGTSKALSEPLKKNSRQTARGTSKFNDVETHDYNKVFDSTYHRYTINVHRKSELKVVHRGGCLTQIQSETRADKLGLYEIPSSIWDLMPCSFIFDWFWNIGDTISAWTPRLGSKVLASWVTRVIEQTQTVSLSCSECVGKAVGDNYGEPSLSIGDALLTKTTWSKVRTPNPAREIIPSFDVNMSPAKLIDLGIILKHLALNRRGLLKYRI